MFELLQKFYGNLPEGAKQAPALALLIIAITSYSSGKWMSGSACKALRDSDQQVTTELRTERDEYKKIAFNSVGFLTERAEQSAKINEQAVKLKPTVKPTARPKPAVATVKVPMTPVTALEKKDVEKPKDAEAATLTKSLEASKKVLQKTDIANAEPVKNP